jgi:hypothetical protein
VGVRHRGIGGLVVHQPGYFSYDRFRIGADKFHRTSINGFGTFGCIAHHEHGLAEAWCFLLDSTGIGQNQVALAH